MKRKMNKVQLHEKQPKTQQSNKTKPKQRQLLVKETTTNLYCFLICLCGWERWTRNGLNKVKMCDKQPQPQQSNETEPKQRQHMQKKQK